MVVVMQKSASEEQIQEVINKLMGMGFDIHRSTGAQQTVLGAVGAKVDFDVRDIEVYDGVSEVLRISAPYKLASRQFRHENTIVNIGEKIAIGSDRITVMAGPCSVEGKEQMDTVAASVAAQGAQMLRGGAFKPRSSPYSFQGMGEEGLKLMRKAADANGLKVVSEVMDARQIPMMLDYADMLQVGARNMQNFDLLKELGRVSKPILLKRGISATIEELLLSAEYILAGGNYQVVLCERGIRTFESYTKNTLDVSAIPVIQKLSHLPILADPSHGTGRRDKVMPMARAAAAAGADGLMVEVHPDPNRAWSDGAQSLYPDQFAQLMKEVGMILSAVNRTL